MHTPAAFISYAHLDDHAYGGRITRLRERLEGMAGSAIGRKFRIFQDRNDIGWGQHFPSRLEEGLNEALFLIPILTPAYFNSDACRAELKTFLELESRSGRNDRILPLYFLDAPVFEHKHTELAAKLRERQYRDWRQLVVDPLSSVKAGRALHRLAREIAVAVHRMEPQPPAVAPSPAVVLGPDRPDPRTQVSVSPGSVEVSEGSGARPDPWVEPVWPEDDNDYWPFVWDIWTGDPGPTPPPGTIFKDSDEPWCPEMVVIPAGSFFMGSPEDEESRARFEGPQHQVRFERPFALGRFPVSSEYVYFCEATGRARPDENGVSYGRRPVTGVSWNDAKAFAAGYRTRRGGHIACRARRSGSMRAAPGPLRRSGRARRSAPAKPTMTATSPTPTAKKESSAGGQR